MKNKKIIINNPIFIYLIFIIIGYYIFAWCAIFGENKEANLIEMIIFIVHSIKMTLIFICSANYFSTIVIYDGKTLYRRGLFWGLKLRINIEDIKEIGIADYVKVAYYNLIDDTHFQDALWSSKSTIKLEYNSKNKKFIRIFWNGRIPEIKNQY